MRARRGSRRVRPPPFAAAAMGAVRASTRSKREPDAQERRPVIHRRVASSSAPRSAIGEPGHEEVDLPGGVAGSSAVMPNLRAIGADHISSAGVRIAIETDQICSSKLSARAPLSPLTCEGPALLSRSGERRRPIQGAPSAPDHDRSLRCAQATEREVEPRACAGPGGSGGTPIGCGSQTAKVAPRPDRSGTASTRVGEQRISNRG